MKGYLKHEPTHFLSRATCFCSRFRHTRERKNKKPERLGGGVMKREGESEEIVKKLRRKYCKSQYDKVLMHC